MTAMQDPNNQPAGFILPSMAEILEVPGMLAELAQGAWGRMSEDERKRYPHIGRMANMEAN